MSIKFKDLTDKALAILQKAGHYLPLLFIVSVLSLYGYLILHVNQLTQAKVDELEVLELLQDSPRPQIDQQAVDTILRLQDQNVEIETLFQEARDNPFAEQE